VFVNNRRGAERLAEQLRLVLGLVAAEPSAPLSRLDLLPAGERHRLLVTWNKTEVGNRSDTLQQLFERQVERRADGDAVAYEDDVVSFAELSRRANRVAARLRRAGLSSGDLVGIRLERSIEMVVAIVGVAKSGAAFLPLDPSAPRDRSSFMLADSGACALIAQRPGDAPWARTRRLTMSDLEAGPPAPESDPAPPAKPDDVAYVIYTSGSTGRPKGVEVTNAGLANVLQSMGREPGLSPTDTQLAVASVSFDLALLELLGPLAAGARVVVAPSRVTTDGRALIELLRRWDVTYVHATPATWRLLIGAGWQGLGTAVSGGEALTADLARQLLARATTVWNSYGPTETAIGSTLARVSDPDEVTIGRPIANTRLGVFDRTGRPVPLGSPGELYIGGAGVAKGYLNRPSLTSERFPEHPDLGRVYKTGDLVRQRDDGALEYLGRTDDQVKIRGLRVEPGEVTAALTKHEGIEDAVVIATDGRDGKRLVGYLVEAAGAEVRIADLRNALARGLPEQMIPTAFAKIHRVPLTSSGKVDRARLPAPDRALAAAEYTAPATPVERALARIWADALGVDRVGTEDDFFVLGGHSLLAAEVAARAGEALGQAVPLRMVFSHPTIARLAGALDSDAPAPETRIQRAPRRSIVL
jgi:amino acid adenylation domain-containing protein